MDRIGPSALLASVAALLAAALPVVMIAAVSALPPVPVVGTDMAWLLPVLITVLVIASAAATVGLLVLALRRGSPAAILGTGASGALAGGGVVALADGGSLAVPVLACAGFLAAAGAAGALPTLAGVRTRVVAAAGVITVAEAAALFEMVPLGASVVAGSAVVILAIAAALAGISAVTTLRGGAGVAALTGAGSVGLLADRGGSLELILGLAALGAAQLLALRGVLTERHAAVEPTEIALPELAARLSEAVLRFDGRLQLRDWNPAAAALLGLDTGSAGARLEDLLGVPIAELPSEGNDVVTRSGLGGLDIAMHRSGSGITAVIRDPATTSDSERLGIELRATIEELLRARRTIDLQRGELERSATSDALTGVASRSAIIDRLRTEVAQARRYRHPLAVVLLDVDGFGDINLAHGIEGGDGVLREIALRIRLRVREADALGRCGSDGFLAILPHTDEAGAATFADALRHRLALRPIAVGAELVEVTVSIGVATMRPGEDLDVDGLLARVEEALASARSGGGDRIALDQLHGLARLEDPHRRPEDEAAG